MRFLLLAWVFVAFPALSHSYEKGDLQIRHPWARATPPGTSVGVGYFEIRNNGAQPDRLLSATSPAAKRVEMHITEHAGNIAKMRQLRAFEVPARERLTLEPNGAHLMLIDLAQPLRKGERFPIKLRFERAGEIEVEFEVQELGSRHPRH
jgi:copper(I)-binding protein